jgi:hypothetical protein
LSGKALQSSAPAALRRVEGTGEALFFAPWRVFPTSIPTSGEALSGLDATLARRSGHTLFRLSHGWGLSRPRHPERVEKLRSLQRGDEGAEVRAITSGSMSNPKTVSVLGAWSPTTGAIYCGTRNRQWYIGLWRLWSAGIQQAQVRGGVQAEKCQQERTSTHRALDAGISNGFF